MPDMGMWMCGCAREKIIALRKFEFQIALRLHNINILIVILIHIDIHCATVETDD